MAKHQGKVSVSLESQEFFKVYIPEFSHEHLRIPLAFVKVFKGNIPKTAVLRDLRGKCCHVELEEVEKGVFIKNGWQEFVRDHSVEEGDFLVFKYDGKVLFDVNIFGRSGCRKDESPDLYKTIIRVKKEEDTEEETEEELNKPPHDYNLLHLEFGNDRTENSVSGGKSQRNSAIKSEECMGHEAASFVKPKNPHFIALIGRSSKSNLFIPQKVLKKNDIKLEMEIEVRDQKQRLWPMGVSARKDGRLSLVRGWTNFWKANNVRVGDQCLFEFILGTGRISKELHVQVVHVTKMTKKNPCRS